MYNKLLLLLRIRQPPSTEQSLLGDYAAQNTVVIIIKSRLTVISESVLLNLITLDSLSG